MQKHPLGNRDLIRAINRSNVLNTIKTNGSISRIAIARKTGLSAATVTGITADLIADGLIYEKEEGDSRGGRRPILLAINPRGGYVVGIKLMEDHAIGAITDLEASIVAKYSSKLTDQSLDTAIEILVEVVEVLMNEGGIDNEQLLGVGIGLAGIVNAKKGVLRYSPYFGWHDVPLVEILQTRLQVPVHIDNDVNTLTLNEQLFGTGQGIENFITVTIGRGVGLGIVVNGQIYRGGYGGGGEFGHTIIDPQGNQCDCGKKGCLETYVSDPALLRLASEAAARGELPEKVSTIEQFNSLAESGDNTARSIIAQAGVVLGYGIANLINIFNPQEVIISGEGVRAGEIMFTPMRETISQYVISGLADDTDICIDIWEDDAWARGAASLVLRELFTFPAYKEKKE